MLKKIAYSSVLALSLTGTTAYANMFDNQPLLTLEHIQNNAAVGGGFEFHLPVSDNWFVDLDGSFMNPDIDKSIQQIQASLEIGYKSDRRVGYLYNYYIKFGQFVSEVKDDALKDKDEQFGGEAGVNARINQYFAYDLYAGKSFNGYAGINIHLSMSKHVNLTFGYQEPTEKRDELSKTISAGFMFNF